MYDIRPIKIEMRQHSKMVRRNMTKETKRRKDSLIIQKLISLESYQRSNLVLTYVSTPIEVNTHELIRHSLALGKKVAVPRCKSKTREMDFCLIRSFDDLEPGTFNVLEPKKHCRIVKNFGRAFCIIPGLVFDMQGYRLGYGKGYYDRFLSNFKGSRVGVCYACCLTTTLPHGKYDRPINLLVTDKFCKKIQK